MVYRLDAVDAYEKKLAKQIEVASATVKHEHNKPYVRLAPVSDKCNVIPAKIEVDVKTPSGVKRRDVVVYDGDNLEQTTGRAIYADCRIGTIRVERGNGYLELRGAPRTTRSSRKRI